MAAALRTQIYLSREQRSSLDAIAAEEGSSLAELIRLAVDEYLESRGDDPDAVLEATFGAAPEAEAAPRAEWTSRERRVGTLG
jgi:hypothetical protein